MLPTGTYETPAALAFRGGSWKDTRQFATAALLVRHPKGNLLIDVGMGQNVDEHVKLLPAMQRTPYHKGSPAAAQLAAGGLKPGDLAGVIPTHAHWDHISGLEDLGGVPVLVSTEGKAFIETKRPDTELLNSFRGVNYKPYEFEGGLYLGFPRSHRRPLWRRLGGHRPGAGRHARLGGGLRQPARPRALATPWSATSCGNGRASSCRRRNRG